MTAAESYTNPTVANVIAMARIGRIKLLRDAYNYFLRRQR